MSNELFAPPSKEELHDSLMLPPSDDELNLLKEDSRLPLLKKGSKTDSTLKGAEQGLLLGNIYIEFDRRIIKNAQVLLSLILVFISSNLLTISLTKQNTFTKIGL